jgi:hypothetical protein
MGPADATNAAFNPLAGNPLRTRGDLLTALDRCHRPLEACRSACGSRVEIEGTAAVYDDGAAALEGFARPLWGLASAAAGGDGGEAWWPRLAAGLQAGTDRGSSSYWGDIADFDQRIVELPAIAFALAAAPGRLVAPGSAEAGRVASYLRQARGRRVFANNWLLFPALIEVGLGALGEARDGAAIERGMAAIEGFHLGEGWYRDGDAPQVDHYCGFGFHFYSLLLAKLAPDTVDRERIAARAVQFAVGFSRWFDSDGASIPFGRSLTYRFAAAAFFGACAFAGVEALPWGEMKGIVLRHLRWWSRLPIARPGGLLSVGYAYPSAMMAEDYNGPASPYWAFKAFLPLALGEDHPFWRAEEAPAPAARGTCVIPQAGMVLREEQGQVTALSSGQSNGRFSGGAEKYGKFAYSSRYGFSVEGPLRKFEDGCFDSMIAFDDGSGWRVREDNKAEIVDEVLVSRWRPWPDVEIVTRLRWIGPWQVRSHGIRTLRPLRSIEGGFCLPHPGRTGVLGDAQAGMAWAETQGDFSGIMALGEGRAGRLHQPAPNRHLYHPRVIVPQLIGLIAAGESRTACAVLAGPDLATLRTAWAAPPAMLP